MSDRMYDTAELKQRIRRESDLGKGCWVSAFAEELERTARAEELERVLAIVEELMERFEHVVTFKDGTQERVIYSAALEVELHHALRGEP